MVNLTSMPHRGRPVNGTGCYFASQQRALLPRALLRGGERTQSRGSNERSGVQSVRRRDFQRFAEHFLLTGEEISERRAAGVCCCGRIAVSRCDIWARRITYDLLPDVAATLAGCPSGNLPGLRRVSVSQSLRAF